MNHRPRFVITTAVMLAVAAAAWWAGFFRGFGSIAIYETIMIGALGAYGLIGAVAAFAGRFEAARHIANGLPIWALGMTGLGILLAASELQSLTQEAVFAAFKGLALAVSPNVAGIAFMAIIREAMHWSAGEEV